MEAVGWNFWYQVHTHSLISEGGGSDPEAIYNLYLILKIMVQIMP
jgi:hypothetical protein